jgi:hypothetical protein
VEDAIAAAPRRITVYNRLGHPAAHLEDGWRTAGSIFAAR